MATGDLRVREQVSSQEKQALGRYGAQLIKPGQVVMVDGDNRLDPGAPALETVLLDQP